MSSEPWQDWRNLQSRYFSEPRNHALEPGGSEYSRYLWVKEHVPPGARVLDVGCNCGQLAVNLTVDLGCDVVGIDVIPEFIEHCQTEKAAFGHFICADFGAMSPVTVANFERFDVVTALEVIEHAIDIRGFRENVWRALKFGGKLIITTPHPEGITGYDFKRDYPCHVRMWTRWRLEHVFGPMTAYEEIHRDECGKLLSVGAVFVKERG